MKKCYTSDWMFTRNQSSNWGFAQIIPELTIHWERRHLGGIFSLRVAGRDADGPTPSEKSEMRTPIGFDGRADASNFFTLGS